MNWQTPNPFIVPYQVQADDLDFLNHVNNKAYLAWMEEAAWAHSVSAGITHELQTQLNRIMAVYQHQMRYLASCYLNDQLLIGTWIGKQTGRCLRDRHTQIIRVRDAKTVFSATTTFVCIDLQTHQPKAIPNEFIEPYQT